MVHVNIWMDSVFSRGAALVAIYIVVGLFYLLFNDNGTFEIIFLRESGKTPHISHWVTFAFLRIKCCVLVVQRCSQVKYYSICLVNDNLMIAVWQESMDIEVLGCDKWKFIIEWII